MSAVKHRVNQGWLGKTWRWLSERPVLIGLAGLAWIAWRTGTKPSRAAYPCQRAAALQSAILLGPCVAPILSVLGGAHPGRRRLIGLLGLGILAVGVIWMGSDSVRRADARGTETLELRLTLAEQRAQGGPASDLFVVNGAMGGDAGIGALFELMADRGTPFYAEPGTRGLIASDDVVLIKVNAQWDERGGTNTDLVKALIAAILDHPGGFSGEIIVADNGQAQYGSAGHGGRLDWENNNAEDRTQSMQAVVDGFAVAGRRVSATLWDTITTQRVEEYETGDERDGYVLADAVDPATGALAAYPKFTTAYGTRVSFARGIWNAQAGTYDPDCLKVINVPVLKTHAIYGVTACVKHYMGVTSDKLTARAGARAHASIASGGMGTEMVETRLPVLNLLDAIWINAQPGQGPATPYSAATRVNIVAASTDPVALDAWAARHILIPAAQALGFTNIRTIDPDRERASGNLFAHWLAQSAARIAESHPVTTDEARMSVFIATRSSEPGPGE